MSVSAPVREGSASNLDRTHRRSRAKSRVARAGDEGVWMAALCISFVAWGVPAWLIGASLALAGGEASVLSQAGRIAMLVVGVAATVIAARSAVVVSRAPRLGKRHYRRTLRYAAAIVAVLTAAFLWQILTVDGIPGSDILMVLCALGPTVLMAELSFAIPAIANGRHGTAIGATGGFLWSFASIALAAITVLPAIWWLAPLLGFAAAGCTGPAALHLWRHYEGDLVGG
ncbi:MAG: hypothetical protein LW806_09070 [Planctomycetaceae bacterium]|nr:hypothetical protein [Planctomycetaceae bacterium]